MRAGEEERERERQGASRGAKIKCDVYKIESGGQVIKLFRTARTCTYMKALYWFGLHFMILVFGFIEN